MEAPGTECQEMRMQPKTVFVATLGGQPQVVTLALDVLLDQGQPVDEVIVIHLGAPPYRQAFRRLAEAFPGDRYRDRPCHFRGVPVMVNQRVLDDVRTTADADAAWRTIHQLIGTLKASNVRLHLLLAGGRRLLALMAVSAALLHLEHGDKVWHLYTPDAVLEMVRRGSLLHVGPSAGVQLIEVPLAPLGAYFPGIRPLLGASPSQLLAAQMRWLDSAEQARCRKVVERLTPRQLDTLRAFVAGLSPREVAERLVVTIRTVDAHKTVILAECRNAWGLPDDTWLTYHFLRDQFGQYFATMDSV